VLNRLLGTEVPARFETDLPLEEAVARRQILTTRYGSGWIPRTDAHLIGTVTASTVRIWKDAPRRRNRFTPLFLGAFRETPEGRLMLAGRFTMHRFATVFVTVGAAFLLLATTFLAVFAATRVRHPALRTAA
jgi:hypothetical protein